MEAARGSKNQWRAFLFTLVEEGDIDVLSPRDAMTQLPKQLGADVQGSDRVWIKQGVRSCSVCQPLLRQVLLRQVQVLRHVLHYTIQLRTVLVHYM